MEARTYAFTQFYPTEHESQVRRAYLLLGSPVTAHDVVADAFMAVYQRWDAIAEPGPYLNRCVLNGCRDAQRKGGRERPFRDVADEASVDDGVDEMAELLLDLPFRQPAAPRSSYGSTEGSPRPRSPCTWSAGPELLGR
ncbi:MAG: hypothetical protein GY939_11375 [Actinomycetia bacterium]|nr:hypothetical protein [Actinomycetes bacterium]